MLGGTSASRPSGHIIDDATLRHYKDERADNGDSKTTKNGPRVPMKKRKYSRGGCIECKRRKIKCDEGKPFCFNCTKVKKVCSYMTKKFTFEPVEVNVKNDKEPPPPPPPQQSPDIQHVLLQQSLQSLQLQQLQLTQLQQPQHLQHRLLQHLQHLQQPLEHGQLPPVVPYQNPAQAVASSQPMFGLPEVPQQRQLLQHLLNSASPNIGVIPPPNQMSQPVANPQFYGGPPPAYLQQNIPPQSFQNLSPGFSNALTQYPPALEQGVSQMSTSSSMVFPIPSFAMDPLYTEALELATDIGDFLHEENFVPILQTFDSTSSVTSLSADSIAQSLNNNQVNALNGNTVVTPNDMVQSQQDSNTKVRIAQPVTTRDAAEDFIPNKSRNNARKHKQRSVKIGNNALREFIHEHHIAFVDYNSEPYSVPTQDALDEDVLHELESFNVEKFAKEVVADFRLQTTVPKYSWHPDLSVPNDSLIDAIAQQNPLFEKHLPYLKILTNTPLSYHLYPFAESIESNEVLKILLTNLKHSPFLLASLLAMSATFQYNQSGAKVHEQLRFKYATLCLILLGDAFSQHIAKDNSANFEETVPKIENLVLTVLALTSIFTAIAYSTKRNFLDNWKVHLRGAKDLLVNYLRLSKTHNIKRISFGMALALIWFTAIEVIAILNAQTGGVLREQSQIDDIFSLVGDFKASSNNDIHEALQRLRLLSQTSKEFNTYLGHTHASFELIADVCKEKMRMDADHSTLCKELTRICARMETARATAVIPQCDIETFIIPSESPLHPHNKSYSDYNISMAAYAEETDAEGKSIFYSWFDLVEQLHLDYVFMKVLTMKGLMRLPRAHPLVQDMVRQILNATFFIKHKSANSYLRDKERNNILLETETFYLPATLFDMRCIMVQSPLRIAGVCSFDDEQLERVEIFFMGCVKLGNGSSMTALHAISRHRERLKATKSPLTHSEVTVSTYLDDDLTEYMDVDGEETIPFA